MKITLPDQLKNDVPKNQWGKVLSSTPVVMTVVATLLAGLASSEMTRAQYDRSLGAQQQSKAGDQWSFFQAKRLRSALQENTLELLQGTTELHPLDDASLRQAAPQLPDTAAPLRTNLLARLDASAGPTLLTGPLPDVSAEAALDAGLKTALAAVENSQPESAIAPLLAPLPVAVLNTTLLAAQERAQSFDAAIKPANEFSDLLLQLAAQLPFNAANTSLRRDITVLRLRYLIRRYDAEARLNQRIANLLELQVRKSNLTAERHHRRSQRFFFGMLAAQAAVIVSTFALATSRRSLLWSLAAAAGLVAILFAIYVYLFV
ncbi:MAG: DUF4337 family protein [Verrucomicrobiota bacterium]